MSLISAVYCLALRGVRRSAIVCLGGRHVTHTSVVVHFLARTTAGVHAEQGGPKNKTAGLRLPRTDMCREYVTSL